ncbi:MAG: hypothetical protein HOY71_09700, partial [Nonomuraea sp.]|nr:hypothetical protein [Nonomuraea sp.]
MSLVLAPQHLTESARADWHALQAETPHPRRFDPADADRLPEPARGWVLHAIAPGTPLRRTAVLSSHGRIRLGAWRSYTAQQVLAPPAGYVWAASTFPVRGFDRYR